MEEYQDTIFVYNGKKIPPVPKNVVSVSIHPSVQCIDSRAFESRESLGRISMIPGTLRQIQNRACYQCKSLTNIDLPQGLESIGIESFAGCTSLKVIRIPSTVVTIGRAAFQECSSLEQFEFMLDNDGLSFFTTIEYRMFQSCTSLTKVSLPKNIKTIEKNAFYGCTSLVHVDLNHQQTCLTSIADQAFGHCTSLTTMTIPSTVTRIGEMAFSTCQSLASVQFLSSSSSCMLKAIHYGNFWRCTALKRIEIPKSVKMIAEQAFDGCTSLSHVQFQEGLVTIGKRAFTYCQLITLKLPSTVQIIGPGAFYNNESLVQVEFPKQQAGGGLTTIASGTFQNCKALSTLSIPSSILTIGERAFCGCSSLVDIEFFQNDDDDALLQTIGNVAFANCSNLCAVAFPKSLNHVGTAAFFRCPHLLGVEIRSSSNGSKKNNIQIDHRCFDSCAALVNVSIPTTTDSDSNNIQQQPAYDAFAGCQRLMYFSEGGGTPFLHGRYDDLPIHQVLYRSSVITVNDLVEAIDVAKTKNDDDGLWNDRYGLTPLHVLAASSNPSVDFLNCLLDNYGTMHNDDNVLTEQDKNGDTMMDYLLQHHTSRKAIPLVKMILQRAVLDRMSECGLALWNSELSLTVDSMTMNDSIHARRKVVGKLFDQVGFYMRLETTSLMELALWKRKVLEEVQESSGMMDSNMVDRRICRYQCGADLVIENVVGFLWKKDEPKAHSGLSLFPLCSPMSLEQHQSNGNLN